MLRIGLIGVGRWGRVYVNTLLSLREHCALTHLATSRPENAALVPHPVTVRSDWRALVRADCDAVIIATPAQTHAEILEGCLDAGKPCLVEKPLCLDVPTAERLHRRVEASGVPVLVDHTFLFHGAYRALKAALREAGEPIRLISSEGMALGPFSAHTPALWDWCPHDLSLCLDLLGTAPDEVAALGGPTWPGGHPEQVSVRLEFPGGVCAWIQAGRLSPVKRRTLSVFTDRRLFLLDTASTEPLGVWPFALARRYEEGFPGLGERRTIRPASTRPPMEEVVSYFVQGLAGGDRQLFGTALALEIVTILARCQAMLNRSTVAA